MNIRLLESDCVKVLAPLITTQIIVADQNRPAPSDDYITLGVSNIESTGRTSLSPVDEDGNMTLDTPYEITIRVGGLKSKTQADLFKLSAHVRGSPLTLDGFIGKGLYFTTASSVREVPVLIQGEIEERAEFDMMFNYVDSYIVDVGYIDKTSVEGTYKDVDDSTILVETIEIDFPD